MRLFTAPRPRHRRVPAVAAAVAAAVGSVAAAAAIGSLVTGTALAAGPKACQTAGLVSWLDNENGAAGSVFYTLNLTNLSGGTCTVRGFPGVSAINLKGAALGRAASRTSATAVKTVTLRSGASAHATLRITEAGNFPASRCGLTTAAGLRVYPPNQRASKVIPLPFPACAKRGVSYLSVQALK